MDAPQALAHSTAPNRGGLYARRPPGSSAVTIAPIVSPAAASSKSPATATAAAPPASSASSVAAAAAAANDAFWDDYADHLARTRDDTGLPDGASGAGPRFAGSVAVGSLTLAQ